MKEQAHEISTNPEHLFNITVASEASFRHPQRNEDYACYNLSKGWAAVFDGLGGGERGDLASRAAGDIIGERLNKLDTYSYSAVEKSILEACTLAGEKIREISYYSGTTAVIAQAYEAEDGLKAVIASSGDSRAYLFRNKHYLKLLTHDDSVIPYEIAKKIDEADNADQFTHEDWDYFYERNIVKEYLGKPEAKVRIQEIDILPGDVFILTSDGVHDNLSNNMIRNRLIESRDASKLVKGAMRIAASQFFRSKPDDITAAILTF